MMELQGVGVLSKDTQHVISSSEIFCLPADCSCLPTAASTHSFFFFPQLYFCCLSSCLHGFLFVLAEKRKEKTKYKKIVGTIVNI